MSEVVLCAWSGLRAGGPTGLILHNPAEAQDHPRTLHLLVRASMARPPLAAAVTCGAVPRPCRRAGKAGLPGAACPTCGHCSAQQQQAQQQQCGGGSGEAGEAAAALGGACCPNRTTARGEVEILGGDTSAGAPACPNCSASGEAPGCRRSEGCSNGCCCSTGRNTAGAS